MTVHMTNREICLKAAQRLREVGWQQGVFGPEDGPNCMLGACRWATGYHADKARLHELQIEAADACASAYAHTHVYCGGFAADEDVAIAWNDEPGRTVEEVIATLEACP